MSTTIEWTKPPGYRGDTWNPLVGCSRKSTGCEHCYAEVMASRIANASQAKWRAAIEKSAEAARALGGPLEKADDVRLRVLTHTEIAYQQAVVWQIGGSSGPANSEDVAQRKWSRKLVTLPHALTIPLRTKAPTCYFVNSMSDLFHEDVPFSFIDQVFAVMAMCPQHIFQVLTKRADRMAEYMRQLRISAAEWQHELRNGKGRADAVFTPTDVLNIRWLASRKDQPSLPVIGDRAWPLPNVWLGTSVENQATADERIPHLLRVPAVVRFLSMEPLLGSVDLREFMLLQGGRTVDPRDTEVVMPGIDWVIVGGESGHGARPFSLDDARDIAANCHEAGVPLFVKQLGARPYWLECVEQPLCGCRDACCMHVRPAQPRFLKLVDRKGGDMSEWPEDLRVQEWPAQMKTKGMGAVISALKGSLKKTIARQNQN